MVTQLAVMSSDSLNRYGFMMHIKALEGGILQKIGLGMPYLINHDFHRPIGWSLPFALFIEPGLTRQLSINLFPETPEEKKDILLMHQRALGTRYDDAAAPFRVDFQRLLEEFEIKDFNFIYTNCLSNFRKGISKEIFPELFAGVDKEGLIPFNNIFQFFDYLGQGVFKFKSNNLCVFAHRYFRRAQSVHNSLNSQFLDTFIALRENEELDLYLCIDEDQVGYAPSFHDYQELEYVYGPKFNDDIASIKPGLVKHQHTDTDRQLSGIASTEILWEWDKDLYTFQLEEVSDREAPMEENSVFHCRYVHSIYNYSISDFDHFDGAIRTYPFDDMVERASKNFKEYGKNSSYKKLFKVNKKLPIHQWKSLVTLFMRGNSLIYEYFGFKDEIEKLKAKPKERLALLDSLLPFRIAENEGLKLLVSYFKLTDMPEGRFIDSFDIMSDGKEKFKCVDFPILELKKALQRIDDDLIIPPDIEYIKCEDRYWNIPSIMHIGHNSEALISNTVTAMKNLFGKMIDNGMSLDISITLGMVVDSKIIKVSAFGNILVLYNWLETSMPFPANQIQFTDWLSAQKLFLSTFENSGRDTFLGHMVQNDGVLYAKRKPVTYPYQLDVDENGLGCRIELPEEEEKLMAQGQLKMVATVSVEKCQCSDTGEDYFTSKRSKWLDDDLPSVDIVQASPLALYWSAN